MRKASVLTALFPAVRQGLLAATLGQPDKWWYLSELAGRLGTSPSSLQRRQVIPAKGKFRDSRFSLTYPKKLSLGEGQLGSDFVTKQP
jgi:hypothetical protein